QAEAIAQYCKKGTPLFVEGRLRLRTWEDKDGNKHSKHEIILSAFQFIGGTNNQKDDIKLSEDDEDVPF
ncbi:MAG: single-stranded DNA-binding protein, partial [Desulfurella sp.]